MGFSGNQMFFSEVTIFFVWFAPGLLTIPYGSCKLLASICFPVAGHGDIQADTSIGR
jgi:hypothetical protein